MNPQSLTIPVEDLDERLHGDPRPPYRWWRQFTPFWLDMTLGEDGSVTFTPNGRHHRGPATTPGILAYKSMVGWINDTPMAFPRGVSAR